MTGGAHAEWAAIDQAGPEWDGLFRGGPGLQSQRTWFEASAAAAVPAGSRPGYVLIRDAGVPAAVVPMRAGPGRRLQSLTTPYTCLYQPLILPSAPASQLTRIGIAFGRWCRAPATLLEGLDPDWPGLAPMVAGFRQAGLAVRRFDNFGNWHLPVPGWSWQRYLESRPGPLRETIRRKTKAAGREPGLRLELVQDPAALGPALAAYEHVYARSWKQPEPFPSFNQTLVDRMADSSMLRIGLLWVGSQPVAAQYWAVAGGAATVLKLAHNDTFKPLSPGTVLTAFVIRRLLEDDTVTELDFGRGDDPYKRQWAECRRQRIGLLLASPLHVSGLRAVLEHDGGTLVRKLRRLVRPAVES